MQLRALGRGVWSAVNGRGRLVVVIGVMTCFVTGPLSGQVQHTLKHTLQHLQDTLATPSPSTAAVFRRFSDRVVKIQVIENSSAAKASLGSGFFVSSEGTVMTNYHVISKIVNDPTRYHAEVTDVQNRVVRVRVVAVDVVHDLAVLQPSSSSARPAHWFTLDSVPVAQGDRLYSLGHPRDLGLSVVEGTYNGLLEYTLYPKIHFSGSINPGMSGGPTITAQGRVVGVNVSTAGNGIGFLVPVARAAALLANAEHRDSAAAPNLLADVARQIRAYQDVYLRGMFGPGSPTARLGAYRVPTYPAKFFKCWADVNNRSELAYVTAIHQCSTDDELFISEEQSSGVVEMEHLLVSAKTLNATQFAALFSAQFGSLRTENYFGGDEDEVTKFRCHTRNVTNARTTLRVAFCARAYKKLSGLYDAVIRVATLGSVNTGVVSTLKLSGVTFANARTLADRYVRSVTWIR